VHLVGFIIRICHDVRSSECQKPVVLIWQEAQLCSELLGCISYKQKNHHPL